MYTRRLAVYKRGKLRPSNIVHVKQYYFFFLYCSALFLRGGVILFFNDLSIRSIQLTFINDTRACNTPHACPCLLVWPVKPIVHVTASPTTGDRVTYRFRENRLIIISNGPFIALCVVATQRYVINFFFSTIYRDKSSSTSQKPTVRNRTAERINHFF